jgi:hypothetical protein
VYVGPLDERTDGRDLLRISRWHRTAGSSWIRLEVGALDHRDDPADVEAINDSLNGFGATVAELPLAGACQVLCRMLLGLLNHEDLH